MNDEVKQVTDKMKADVSSLMQQDQENGRQVQKSGGIPFGDDEKGLASPDNQPDVGDSDSGDSGDQLSERDRYELDRAIKSGWKEPENCDGHPEDFIKPREWNRNVAWMKRIDREADQRRRLEKQLENFQDRIKNVMEVTRQKTIAELEAQKRQAVEDSDYAQVQQIDSEISKANEELQEPATEPEPQSLRPEVEDWMEETPWFENDRALTNEAVKFQRSQLLQLEDPDNPTSQELRETLEETTKYLKFKYPDKFQMKPRAKSMELERGQPRPSKHKFGYNDLTPEEKKVLSEVERLGGMSREDYIQAIADMRAAGR